MAVEEGEERNRKLNSQIDELSSELALEKSKSKSAESARSQLEKQNREMKMRLMDLNIWSAPSPYLRFNWAEVPSPQSRMTLSLSERRTRIPETLRSFNGIADVVPKNTILKRQH